jgi:small ligand-binding sensory domain FIST
VLGGASSSRDADQDTLQFCGAEISSGAVAGLRLAGGFRHVVGITQGCRPLGDPLRVTRAHDNLILELEGRPALDVLRERAPKGLMEDPERAFHFLFVGLVPEGPRSPSWTGEYLIRNVVAHDPDTGVLAIADHVEEGQHLLFAHREANSARADLSRLAESVAPERTGLRYRFGLYFNCLARGQSLYGEPGVDAATLSRALPGVPLAGFFCGAELAPLGGSNQLFTYTGVLLLVAE